MCGCFFLLEATASASAGASEAATAGTTVKFSAVDLGLVAFTESIEAIAYREHEVAGEDIGRCIVDIACGDAAADAVDLVEKVIYAYRHCERLVAEELLRD